MLNYCSIRPVKVLTDKQVFPPSGPEKAIQSMTTPQKKFDFIVRSTIIRSEKPNKGLEAIAAPNPNQMNRIVGFMPDGTKCIIAQRPGKGGMDFNKLMGGKVYAVAADGLSPVYEKDKDQKPTKNIKHEDGLPLYSSSGFYLMSSKEYMALDMFECYTHLVNKGAQVLLVTDEQLKATQSITLESEFDLELLNSALTDSLADSFNLVSRFDLDINKKRRRGIERAKEEAEDASEQYAGVNFNELSVSKKDGNPFVMVSWNTADGIQSVNVLREVETLNEDGRPVSRYFTPEEAVVEFASTPAYKKLEAELAAGRNVVLSYTSGHVMRTSVSFRRKVENVLAAGTDKPLYGDAVYIHGAMQNWCRGLVSILHSLHPNFPTADYDAQHYVVAVRQAEIGMMKKADGGGWFPPQIVHHPLEAYQFT